MPLWSSGYNGLQTQLTRNAGKNTSVGVVYTYSHAIDYEDNGAGSGSGGTAFNYPAFFRFNRGSAGFDEKHNLQIWGVYSLPFGPGQMWLNHGLAGDIDRRMAVERAVQPLQRLPVLSQREQQHHWRVHPRIRRHLRPNVRFL